MNTTSIKEWILYFLLENEEQKNPANPVNPVKKVVLKLVFNSFLDVKGDLGNMFI